MQSKICTRSALRRLSSKSGGYTPTTTTLPRNTTRTLHTTPAHQAGSPLFALGALSNSRESQWFKKASGLSAVEHSPNLQLIRDSEVVPFASGGRGGSEGKESANGKWRRVKTVGMASGVMGHGHPKARYTIRRLPTASTTPPLPPSTPFPLSLYRHPRDIKALSIGREILRRNAEHVGRLKRSLRQEQRIRANEVASLKKENRRLVGENRSASVGIILAVGVATAVVAWKTWPESRKPRVGFGASGKKDEALVSNVVKAMEEEAPVLASLGEADVEVPLLPLGEVESVEMVDGKGQEPWLGTSAGMPSTDHRTAKGWGSWFWSHS